MKILLLIIAFSTSYSVSAQNAKEISTKYNRVVVPGVEITFRNSKDVVKSALNDYLEKELKGKKSSKGFDMYENVSWPLVSDLPLSVFSKVEGGRRSATITMLISTPTMAFYSSLGNANYMENLKAFLNGFEKDIAKEQQGQDIAQQTDEIKKVEDKISKNQKQAAKLQSDKEKLEKDIADNLKELESLNQDLQKEKDKLEKVKN